MRSSLLNVLLFTSAGVMVHGVALAQSKAPPPPAAPAPAAPAAPPAPPAAAPTPAPVGATPPVGQLPAEPVPAAAPAPAPLPPPVAAPPVAAPPVPAPPQPPLAPAPPVEPIADGTVEVHLTSSSSHLVSLERRAAPGAPWEHVCDSPCDVRTPSGLEHRIVGIAVNPSKPFTISPSPTGKVQLNVEPGFRRKESIGIGVAVAGGVVTVAGLIVVIAGSASANTFQSDGTTHNGNTDFIAAGTLMMLGGLATAITGGGWAYQSSRSTVGGDVVTPSGKDAAVSRSGQLARTSSPMGFTLPVLSGSF